MKFDLRRKKEPISGSNVDELAPPDNARENGNYAGIRCSQKRAIMLALCSDYAAYKPAYKMKFTYRFTYILISTGFLCGYERHRPNSISGSPIYFPVKTLVPPTPVSQCISIEIHWCLSMSPAECVRLDTDTFTSEKPATGLPCLSVGIS